MFCDKCGTRLNPNSTACPSCGKPTVPLMPPPARGIAGHVRLMGILWVAYGALHAIPALFFYTILGAIDLPPEFPGFVRSLMGVFTGLFLATGALGILAGAGLLTRATWGRLAALIAGAMALLNIPLGTALGIYTFWALLPAGNEEEYRSLSRIA